MSTRSLPRVKFDGEKAYRDMVAKTLDIPTVAKSARLSERTVYRFFTNDVQTARTAAAIADALGHSIRRYMVDAETAVA